MNERNRIKRLRKLANYAGKRFTDLGKPSKLLLKICFSVFFAFILAALVLLTMHITETINVYSQINYIKWMILYSFRFCVVIIIGALILDVFIKK